MNFFETEFPDALPSSPISTRIFWPIPGELCARCAASRGTACTDQVEDVDLELADKFILEKLTQMSEEQSLL